MMKKQKLLFRLVIPTMLILFLLPPVSCLIFRHAAHDYAYSEATDELSELQNSILTAVGESFDGTLSEKTGNADKNSESNVRKKRGGILRRFTGPEEGSLSRTPKTALRSRNSSQSEIQRERNKSNNENSTVKAAVTGRSGKLVNAERKRKQQFRKSERDFTASPVQDAFRNRFRIIRNRSGYR